MKRLFTAVRHPIATAKERAMAGVIAGLIRHGLTAAGLSGLLSGDEMNQAVGAIATLIGLAWSVVPKVIAARAAAK